MSQVPDQKLTKGEKTMTTAKTVEIPEIGKPGSGRKTKELWEMTRAEAIENEKKAWPPSHRPQKVTGKGIRFQDGEWLPYKKIQFLFDHEMGVKRAVEEGKPVPAEVLADYPDLQPKPAKAEAGERGKGQ